MNEAGTGRRKTRSEKRADRRIAIKQAAIEIFSEKGYHAAKVSQIVKRVGVAQGTFYLYYESKHQIFGELLNDFLTLVVETVAAWEPAELDSRVVLRDELTRVGVELTNVILENQGLATIFFKEGRSVDPEFNELIDEFNDTLAAMLTNFNRILCDRGVIKPMNFQLLAYMTLGMVERVISEYIVTGVLAQDGAQPREVVEHLVMHFLAGTTEAVATGESADSGE